MPINKGQDASTPIIERMYPTNDYVFPPVAVLNNLRQSITEKAATDMPLASGQPMLMNRIGQDALARKRLRDKYPMLAMPGVNR